MILPDRRGWKNGAGKEVKRLRRNSSHKMATEDANEILTAWETSSQYWNKYRALIEKMLAPLTTALVEGAQIGPGQTVIDIGGGSGEPSLTVASIVGEKGRVIYTDPSIGMVNSARAEAERRGLRNISFHQCPADELPFSKNSFDVALSRLSAMFFPDVLAGLRQILSVIQPGGVVALVIWASREANPFFTMVTDILDTFVPADPEDEDAPAAFRFAKPGKLAKILQEAGATSVKERAVDFKIQAPITVPQFWDLRTEMSDTFRGKLKKLEPEAVVAVRDAVEKAAAQYFLNGQMNFPAQALMVTGEKPSNES